MVALWLFGFLNDSLERRSIDLWVQGGTDNRSIEQMRRKAARWPLVLVNMQLSDSLMRAGLWVGLKWRPRDENTIEDDLAGAQLGAKERRLKQRKTQTKKCQNKHKNTPEKNKNFCCIFLKTQNLTLQVLNFNFIMIVWAKTKKI